MAQKTDAELLIEADIIKTETTPLSNTADRIGQMYEDIIESKVNNSRMNYKQYEAILGFNGSSFTLTEQVNEIGGVITYGIVGNGRLSITSSTGAWTSGSTKFYNTVFNNAGEPYFVTGSVLSTSIIWVDLIKFDGTRLSTPNFSINIEIKVYN